MALSSRTKSSAETGIQPEPVSTASVTSTVRAGSLMSYIHRWKGITADRLVITTIQGYKLPFVKPVPFQTKEPKPKQFSETEQQQIQSCLSRMLSIGAILKVESIAGQFLSPIFVIPKPDGTGRFILNLKKLNTYMETSHFKMEDYRTVSQLLQPNDFMAKIDLQDAYYLIPIADKDKKFLRFRYNEHYYEFQCMPFGLSTAPRVFTKLMKPVLAILREKGHKIVAYLDDLLLLGKSAFEVNCIVTDCLGLLSYLGLIINEKKSELEPQQNLEYLGFVFDSIKMSMSLPKRKVISISKLLKSLLRSKTITIQFLSEVLGTLVAATPAVSYSLVYTKQLEMEKSEALIRTKGLYTGTLVLSTESRGDIRWWLDKLPNSSNSIKRDCYEFLLTTDASNSGWGCEFNNAVTRGFWTAQQKGIHINTLELLAIELSLNSFCSHLTNCNILLRVDSTTAISYVNKKGGCRSKACLNVAKNIWKWCEVRNIWVFATYINTKQNVIADNASRSELDENDFSLDSPSFQKIVSCFGTLIIDLFATHVTTKCDQFFSWFPDPLSSGVDAFTYKWPDFSYAFPPFLLIGRVLIKVIEEKAKGILVVPQWKSQAWFPIFNKLIVSDVLVLRKSEFKLICPYDDRPHPLSSELTLLAAVISG